jgi:fatty-acid peroxygenase
MAETKPIPRDKGMDNTLALMTEGYLFIPNRTRKLETDIFRTRLLGQTTICMAGKDAARIFYDESKFRRRGAVPKRIQKSLMGEKAIQTMDDEAHKHRKGLFMSLMTPQRLQMLNLYVREEWCAAAKRWSAMDSVLFFKEVEELMVRVACRWAGVPLREQEVEMRARDMGALIDSFGGAGPRHWQGRQARRRSEDWIEKMVKAVRKGKWKAPDGTALQAMSWYKQPNGKRMTNRMAAIEVINILRPIVAIGRYITFGAVALHEHPETREKLAANRGDYSQWFVQEVRRYYPFGPFTGARVRRNFVFRKHQFKKGTLVFLDLYGTNHHPDLWKDPEEFRPERFRDWKESPFSFIPQGGGEYNLGHRCAGEWVTIEAMKTSLEFLVRKMEYDVPEQDLSYSMARMPTIPKSRFIIRNVRLKGYLRNK